MILMPFPVPPPPMASLITVGHASDYYFPGARCFVMKSQDTCKTPVREKHYFRMLTLGG